ncbi:MAG: glycosyltransferase [Nitrospirota bacterium]|nr:glycosyltransferase [Nitrospirota bacterium]
MNSDRKKYISIVIPNYNKAATVGKCLEAAFASEYKDFEVIVVDDHSDDNSLEIINRYPCRVIALEGRCGTSKARNTGALGSRGDIIFFTDSDCLLQKDTLSIINSAASSSGPDVVIGGTYTRKPYDSGFFNMFQSVFVNYSETKKINAPDYIAAHAMVIDARKFLESGGFPEIFLPIIEDVEFTHRLKRSGCRLVMEPRIQVRHIFGFTLRRSLVNAFRKTAYWAMYSLKNRDVFTDSGSASVELKTNVAAFVMSAVLAALWAFTGRPELFYPLSAVMLLNVFINRRFLKAFYETGGIVFALLASLYYTLLYPLPVGLGSLAGTVRYLFGKDSFGIDGRVN